MITAEPNVQRPTFNAQHSTGHPAERLFPHFVASGAIILPEPRALTTSRHIKSARARWAAQRASSEGQFAVTPETLRLRALLQQWIDTGPHPFGALKGFCADHAVNYSTFANMIAARRAKEKAEAAAATAAKAGQRMIHSPA